MAGLGIVKKQATEITKEDLVKHFPTKKGTITDDVVELMNKANNDPEFNGDEFMKTMVEYQNVMIDCSGSLQEYINAVKFCAYLESETSATEAYKRARSSDQFVIDRRYAPTDSSEYKALTSAAARYRKTPMVRQILTQSDMPLYLMFQGARYKAVAVLAREMESAKLAKDRVAAADKLLGHVKPPENMDVELKFGPNKEAVDLSTRLSEQLAQHVAMQKKLIENGVDISDATKTGINLVDDYVEDAEISHG